MIIVRIIIRKYNIDIQENDISRRAQPWLGTLVDITIDDDLPHQQMTQCHAAAFAAIARVHRLMNFRGPDSDVARFNASAPGSTLTINAATWAVLAMACRMQAESAGAFHIGVAARLVHWGLLPGTDHDPVQFDPASALLAMGEAGQVHKLAAGCIDLGGIAKGYAVDCALEALQAMGVRDACVNAGGDLRVMGQARPVTLRDPALPGRPAMTLMLKDAALATSASYFSRTASGGQTVSALVDGRTGAAIDIAGSVSVVAPTCMLADALTKVVVASGDAHHRLLAQYQARSLVLGTLAR
ncbi:MAG: FAD:protein FMN transferase [Massilia sp.]